MGGVIIPKIYIENIDNPLFFLIGPIRGAPNWQDEAIEILISHRSDSTIVSPRRGVRDRIAKYILEGDENHFPRQRAWERHYIGLASKKGAVVCWLPGEEQHDCSKSYGAMTRLELGQLMTGYRHDPTINFCIGSDGKFSELDTIAYDLRLDVPDKRIFPSLEETCLEALRIFER